MQFLILAYDGNDEGALDRRLAARDEHLARVNRSRQEGKVLYGAAILDESSKMIGSMLVCQAEAREEIERWIADDPYTTAKVWEKIEIKPCKVAPSFVAV